MNENISSLACIFIEKKDEHYSVNIILTPFPNKEEAETVAEIIGGLMGVQNIIEKEKLH